MSLKTLLRKIGAEIKKLFKGLGAESKKAIHIGVLVVEAIKAAVDSVEADMLTMIIPGELDDNIKLKLREFLPKILLEMKLADSCGQLTDPVEITNCAVATLQKITGDWISDAARKNFYDSIAIMVAQVASDGKLDWDDGKVLIKWYYDHVYKAPFVPKT